jgi:hypothetical protein
VYLAGFWALRQTGARFCVSSTGFYKPVWQQQVTDKAMAKPIRPQKVGFRICWKMRKPHILVASAFLRNMSEGFCWLDCRMGCGQARLLHVLTWRVSRVNSSHAMHFLDHLDPHPKCSVCLPKVRFQSVLHLEISDLTKIHKFLPLIERHRFATANSHISIEPITFTHCHEAMVLQWIFLFYIFYDILW